MSDSDIYLGGSFCYFRELLTGLWGRTFFFFFNYYFFLGKKKETLGSIWGVFCLVCVFFFLGGVFWGRFLFGLFFLVLLVLNFNLVGGSRCFYKYVGFSFFLNFFPVLGVIAKGVMIRERGTNRTGGEAHLAPVLSIRKYI